MSYKRLGDFIQQVNVRNTDLQVDTLLGVSISKKLIPSIANTIGTDMSSYKIIKQGQFAYGTVTSRNGEKISIALLDEYKQAIVSQIYIVFEVIDTEILLPDYLMMWFSRPEFDRYARFHSHGSTRETFDWEDMCDVLLPIPSIEKQRQIVAQYQSIEAKIKNNEALCEKLEATAQTLYKHWFVDFEFPDENGKPYKSHGGKMLYNATLEKEIPEGWEVKSLGEIAEISSGKSFKGELGSNYPIYGAGGITGYADDFLLDENIIIIGRVGTHGKVFIEYGKSYPTDNTLVFKSDYFYFTYFILKFLNYDELNKGGVQALLTQTDLKGLKVVIPNFDINYYEKQVKGMFLLQKNINQQTQSLKKLQSLLLVKMGESL